MHEAQGCGEDSWVRQGCSDTSWIARRGSLDRRRWVRYAVGAVVRSGAAWILTLLAPIWFVGAHAATLTQAQWSTQGEVARLELVLTRAVPYRVETLTDPHRLVIELPGTRPAVAVPALAKRMASYGTLGSIMRGGKDLRLVYTTATPVQPRAALSKVNGRQRLTVEWRLPGTAPRPALKATSAGAKKSVPTRTAAKRAAALRPVVIAIDAGHGGDDPGALGPLGTREKDVTLRIARLLAERIRAEPAMKAYLVRDGDHFIPLRTRMTKARAKQADLFVSIHADAAENPNATGGSVFTLSERGATSVAARWLADKENAADLIGGVSLDDKNKVLASVLLDLAQNATSDASYDAGKAVLQQLQQLGAVHQNQVQYAGFAVLKSPDVPSILVETAFISNVGEERKLRSPQYQKRLAETIYAGIRRYFERNPPSGTLFAMTRRHTIGPGDTLAKLAKQYHVSEQALREHNGLGEANLKPGQVLTIPALSERREAAKPLS